MERWKKIEGYEGYFSVSNRGRIRSEERRIPHERYGFVKWKSKIKKLSINSYGYLVVTLCKNGISKTHSVHRLVAKAFVPNPSNKENVNHKDGNKLNARKSNLE